MLSNGLEGAAPADGSGAARFEAATGSPSRLATVVRAALVVALFLLVAALVRTTWSAKAEGVAWGWDESMHAELPAARILLHAREGDVGQAFDVLLGCEQYPFAYPLALAGWQALFGIGEHAARTLGLAVFFLLVVVGVARLARRYALELGPTQNAGASRLRVGRDAALLAALAAAASPLARRYAPTLYLEVPALVGILFALEAWLARRAVAPAVPRGRADLAVGLWIALAFFTKFNYGLMLAAALGFDGLLDVAFAQDRRASLVSLARVFVPLLVACAWWFGLPWPGGPAEAASHREAFLGFVTGNFGLGETQGWVRRTNWLTGIAPHPFLFAGMVLLALAGLARRRSRASVTLAIVLATFVLPVVLHPFHLDRFLLPAAAVLWAVSAAVAARAVASRPAVVAAAAAALAVACFAVPTFRVVTWAGFPAQTPGTAVRAYQERHVEETLGLFGPPAANGLRRSSHERLLDLVADAVGATGRVGWIGQSAEVSPAALHLGLLARGGAVERFLRDAHRPMDLEPVPVVVPSERTPDEVVAFARSFDHVVLCEAGDLKSRPARAWIVEQRHRPIVESGDFELRRLGEIQIERPVVGASPVGIDLASPR